MVTKIVAVLTDIKINGLKFVDMWGYEWQTSG